MSMFKIEELCGSLIKSGRFEQAIPVFGEELEAALYHGVVTSKEIFGPVGIIARFNDILLKPVPYEKVENLGNDMIFIAIRIPNYVQKA